MRVTAGRNAAMLAAVLAAALGAAACAQSGPVLQSKDSGAGSSTGKPAAAPVVVPVVVRNKKGELVEGLGKASFAVQIDGKPAPAFELGDGGHEPVTVGLLVDTSVSERDALEDEKKAGKTFLDAVVGASEGRDKAFVVQFARQTDLLQDVTDSASRLDAAVGQLQTVPGSKGQAKRGESGTGVDPGDGRSSGVQGGTTFYDALFLSSDEVVGKHPGRRVLVVVTDGDDHGSRESLTSALEAAERANATVYALYVKGHEETQRGLHNGSTHVGMGPDPCDPTYPGGYPPYGYPPYGYPGGYPGGCPNRPTGGNNPPIPDGKKVLQRIAKETGGWMFEVSRRDGFDEAFREIREDLRSGYRLSFTPEGRAADDGYHRIDVTVTGAGLNPKDTTVQRRDGYFVGTE